MYESTHLIGFISLLGLLVSEGTAMFLECCFRARIKADSKPKSKDAQPLHVRTTLPLLVVEILTLCLNPILLVVIARESLLQPPHLLRLPLHPQLVREPNEEAAHGLTDLV
jgi:hypothetical protein